MVTEPVNVNEFQELARQALPKMYYDYYAGGAEDQHTLKENVEAFQRITFRPRFLVDVSRINTSTSVLGYKISVPIMIAPTATHKWAHHEGEAATARAAAACNTIMILSCMSSCTVEEVASSCDGVRFFQLYVYKRRDISAQLVQRAERSGYRAIVLTVDAPRLGRREADIKNKLVAAPLKNFEGLVSTDVNFGSGSSLEAFANNTFDASFSWKDIEWLRSITKLPVLIKGVLTREDAIKAMEVGVAGIVVSNHGARQLDYSPASITVLEEVVHVVQGRIPVLFDGGVRRGTDVFKALALGAQAILVGRPVVFGLAANGENGVRRVIEMLKDELELTMALSGCPSIKDISRSYVRTEQERLRSMLIPSIEAVDAGVAGIVVSNQGARQLDYAPASIFVLEEVAHAVKRKVLVIFDGGLKRGADVFKALALGAQAVLVGRQVIFGLAVSVRRVVEMLKDELELTMALSGCPSIKDINRSHVRTEQDRLRSML